MFALVVALIAFVIGIPSHQAQAQARPDFSGRWMIVGAPDGSPPRLPCAAGLGSAFEARQNERSLFLVTGNDPTVVESVVRLDGTEAQSKLGTASAMVLDCASTAEWRGDRLVLTARLNGVDPSFLKTLIGQPNVVLRQVWSLDANNDLLIETTNFLLKAQTSKATYRKHR